MNICSCWCFLFSLKRMNRNEPLTPISFRFSLCIRNFWWAEPMKWEKKKKNWRTKMETWRKRFWFDVSINICIGMGITHERNMNIKSYFVEIFVWCGFRKVLVVKIDNNIIILSNFPYWTLSSESFIFPLFLFHLPTVCHLSNTENAIYVQRTCSSISSNSKWTLKIFQSQKHNETKTRLKHSTLNNYKCFAHCVLCALSLWALCLPFIH